METCEESRCAATVCVLILALHAAALGKIIYVDDDAAGPSDGSSWANAYRFLQDALAEAEATEGPVEIRIAQGLYRPDRSSGRPAGTRKREATFHLVDGATIRGGYAGLGAADPDARDAELHRTVLSGDLAGDDAEHANPLDARADPTRADNSFHVVGFNVWDIREVDLSAELDGFVITGGYAFLFASSGRTPTYMSPTRHFGAGLYVCGGGGGTTAEVVIRDCVFERNYAEEIGGAVYCRKMTQFTLLDCRFTQNGTHKLGGAMHGSLSTIRLDGCHVTTNVAGEEGGGVACWGSSSITLERCTFNHNNAQYGGAMKADERSTLQVSRCVISWNSSTGGSALYLLGSSLEAEDSVFAGNKSKSVAGVIMNSGGGGVRLSLRNCILAGNAAGERGGVLWNQHGDEIHLSSCTAHANRAPMGSFLFDKTNTPDYSVVDITGCIIANGGTEFWNERAEITVRYSDLPDGPPLIHDPEGCVVWGAGIINADPVFVDPGSWDPNGTPDYPNDDFWIDGDYHLKSQAGRWDPASESWVRDDVTSPCIDVGDPNSPIGYEPFPNGGRINMGAYGGTAEASKSYFGEPVCETIIAGDINGDCRVDFKDFQIMAFHWLQERHMAAIPPF